MNTITHITQKRNQGSLGEAASQNYGLEHTTNVSFWTEPAWLHIHVLEPPPHSAADWLCTFSFKVVNPCLSLLIRQMEKSPNSYFKVIVKTSATRVYFPLVKWYVTKMQVMNINCHMNVLGVPHTLWFAVSQILGTYTRLLYTFGSPSSSYPDSFAFSKSWTKGWRLFLIESFSKREEVTVP